VSSIDDVAADTAPTSPGTGDKPICAGVAGGGDRANGLGSWTRVGCRGEGLSPGLPLDYRRWCLSPRFVAGPAHADSERTVDYKVTMCDLSPIIPDGDLEPAPQSGKPGGWTFKSAVPVVLPDPDDSSKLATTRKLLLVFERER
jgi:hypothetical protein